MGLKSSGRLAVSRTLSSKWGLGLWRLCSKPRWEGEVLSLTQPLHGSFSPFLSDKCLLSVRPSFR